ncbi:hypothetical protein HPP05_09795 [Corallococcus exiguus]|uniref:hypothetical protein n=1 Tax=Corallococcus exiguus TaxID=83462 RepID=UPI001493F022|nr:hypothetical protein [Corallococcus exiguus]NPC70034.1 hypothetical protein [Corallococcus exiguus]
MIPIELGALIASLLLLAVTAVHAFLIKNTPPQRRYLFEADEDAANFINIDPTHPANNKIENAKTADGKVKCIPSTPILTIKAYDPWVTALLRGALAELLKEHTHRAAFYRSIERSRTTLNILSALVPKRVSNEEIGDALEFIARMEKERRSKWLVHLKVATTWFWVTIHTFLHYAERIASIFKGTTGK